MNKCKLCNSELIQENSYYTSNKYKKFYKANFCKKCRNKKITKRQSKNRKIKFSSYWFNKRFYGLKRNAKKRNIYFNLSLKEFIKLREKEVCLYCKSKNEKLYSIDRINNEKGYEFTNCAMSCFDCNVIKSNKLSKEETIKFMKFISKLNKQRTSKKKLLIKGIYWYY